MKENTAVVPFRFESQDVRTIKDEKGEPWFIAKDICSILDHSDPHKAVASLDEDERKKVPVIDSLGRSQETFAISESGLYTLIIRSNKPEAKKFRKWVTSEVLPAIRKTGSYSMPGVVSESGTKRCTRCKQYKSLTEFTKYARMKDGLHYYCKDCVRLIQMGIKNVYVGDAPQIQNEVGSIDNEKLNKLYLKALSFVTDCHNIFRKTVS